MRSLTLRRAAVAAVVPLALGSLAACGNGGSTSASDPQAGSPSGAHSPKSTTPKAGSKVSGADYVHLLQASMSKTTTARVSMTGAVSGGSYSMKGVMDLTGDKPAMDITMDLSSSGLTGIETRLVDGVMYVSMGSMTQGKFLKFDLGDPNSPLGSLGTSLDQLDPGKFVSHLNSGAFRHITFVGSDQDGRHFHATALTAKSTTQLKGLPSSVMANLPKTVDYDTWLDGQGRLSKVVVTVPTYGKMTMRYSDYGADVNITAPPASQVTELPTGSAG